MNISDLKDSTVTKWVHANVSATLMHMQKFEECVPYAWSTPIFSVMHKNGGFLLVAFFDKNKYFAFYQLANKVVATVAHIDEYFPKESAEHHAQEANLYYSQDIIKTLEMAIEAFESDTAPDKEMRMRPLDVLSIATRFYANADLRQTLLQKFSKEWIDNDEDVQVLRIKKLDK